MHKEADYLFSTIFSDPSSYTTSAPVGHCSAVKQGSKVLRHFDWYYDMGSTVVWFATPSHDRFASIGCSGHTKEYNLDNSICNVALDGINEAGVYCQVNVINDTYRHQGTFPASAVVRYLLDNASSLQHALTLIQSLDPSMTSDCYHWFIADKDNSYVAEYKDGWHIIPSTTLFNYALSYDNPEGSGLERALIAMNHRGTLEELSEKLLYTHAYNKTYRWYSEFFTPAMHSLTPAFIAYYEGICDRYNPKRDGIYWQTKHRCIYDLENLSLKMSVQEQPDWFTSYSLRNIHWR